ncbi:MAG: family glutathione-dependent formaldehyde-activating protein [Proteobacteria bacterium]|nr:family glutathione-dependent formaldehyde-activating protein [Pseudomonadota bacterium]
MHETTIRHGRCDCGNLRFTVKGEPVHVHACTCTQCQRSTGSVMSYSAWFPVDMVTIEGPYTLHHHRGPEHPERFRGFCPTCGTGRFFQSGAAFPDTIGLAVGSFADPAFPPPSFVLYWDDRPAWLGEPEAVPVRGQSEA